ncbi:MAG: PHB depolymerase family esterase, partial [Marinoscillum sp.]
MKYYYKFFFVLFLIGISGIISSCIKEDKFEKNEIEKCPECEIYYHGGESRGYILYKPVNLSENAPLVFVLHGYTSNAPTIRNITKMNRIADQHGFVVCYPQGTINKWSKTTHWNSGLTYSNTDDIGFLTRLAKYLQNKYNLNPEKTFSS